VQLDAIVELLRSLPAWGVYCGVFLGTIIEYVFPPIPGDAIVVFGGFHAATGEASPLGVFLAAMFGNLTGGLLMYFAGGQVLGIARRLHDRITHPRFIRRWLADFTSEEQLGRTREKFRRHGVWLVLFSRFLAGLRFFVAIVAGLMHMRLSLFIGASLAGLLVWNGMLVVGGYQLGENWRLLLEWIRIYSTTFLLLLTVGVLVWAALRFRRWRRENQTFK